ncbi:hypothetical protein HKD37_07G019657 [Glycine soja]
MATPPASPPPPPPPPPEVALVSSSTLKRTCKVTWLRSLATRPPRAKRPMVHIDPVTGKADSPYKKKLRTYLGIVTRDKVDVTYQTWKEAEFEIPEASDSRTKKKVLLTVGERWRQFKFDLTRKWALAADKDSVDDTVCEKYNISKEKWAQFCQTRRDPSWEKLMAEKTKKKLEEAAQFGSTEGVINPPSPIKRHVKWKMARTKKTRQMTSKAAKEIAEKIASQGSFVPHRRQDVLTAAIGQPEHPGCGLALPSEPEVGPLAARVSTKGSCVDPSPTDPETGDSDKCELYIKENPSCLVALGRVYEGSTMVHNIPLLHGQEKVGVKEVKDAEAPIHVPTDEAAVSPATPPDRLHPEVNDPLNLMILTIPQLFLRPLQLWILHLTETSMQARNSNVYGFLEPQSIQRSGWFCSLHNRPDNYLKGIINSALKGHDDTPQPKSKAGARWIFVQCNRQKGSTECSYYVKHWMPTIILGTFRNNWETYFNDVRPLEAKRLKALRIQWAQFSLKVTNQS